MTIEKDSVGGALQLLNNDTVNKGAIQLLQNVGERVYITDTNGNQTNVNEIYQQIGQSVVGVVSNVANIAYNIYKANEPLIRSIAFSSADTSNYFESHSFSSRFSVGNFQEIVDHVESFTQTPIIIEKPILKSGKGKRPVPIIEEIEDEIEELRKQRHTKAMQEVKPVVKELKASKFSSSKQNEVKPIVKELKVSKFSSNKNVSKFSDIVIGEQKKEVTEKPKPKGRIFDELPKDVHLNDKFLKDLEGLTGPSTITKIMPTLGVCVSKLKKRN